MILIHLAAALAGSIVYCSFLEWVMHKQFMHSTRFMREPFERHAVQHHGMHRSGRSFFADRREEPHYMLIGASFFPIFWLMHVPVFVAFELLVARGSGFGIALGTAAYYVVLPLADWVLGTLSLERLPPEPPEPIIPERIKSWLGGGSRMGQRPGRRNPALVGGGVGAEEE